MRIAINCRSFLKRHYTGIGRYAYHLIDSLTRIDSTNTYELYARKGLFSFKKKAPRFSAKNFVTQVDWFNQGPDKILKNTDIYHCPSPGPLDAPEGSKIIVTVHDLIFKTFPEGHTRETIEIGQKQLERIQKKAAKVICCSGSTANDLRQYFDIPNEKIVQIYSGVDKRIFHPIADDEQALADNLLAKNGIQTPFILSVGTIEPRKNLTGLIKAFHLLKTEHGFEGKLAVIGMKGWMQESIAALVDKLELSDDIIFLGYVQDHELHYYYSRALAFVFPSFYEGFGFPIIEAFCCGAPVVTSNISSCPEVAGDAALTVDPNKPEDIAGAVDKIIKDNYLRDALREKGFQRAGHFSFDRTAQETLKVYEEVHGL